MTTDAQNRPRIDRKREGNQDTYQSTSAKMQRGSGILQRGLGGGVEVPLASVISVLLNRASERGFALPADGWIHLVPIGEYPHPGTGVRQVIDRTTVERMVNRFTADSQDPQWSGLLVDFDHGAFTNTAASTAAGWIDAVEARDDGLYGQVRWSAAGKAAVDGGNYRFISPVFFRSDTEPAGPGRVRPVRLAAAGLTNNPNLRGMVPITNRHAEAADSASPTMTTIATLLGLAAEASVESIRASVQALLNRAQAAETALGTARGEHAALLNRAQALETELTTLRAAEADTIIAGYGDRIPADKRADIRAALLNHRAATLAVLTLLPAQASAPAVMLNRAAMSVPASTKAAADEESTAKSRYAKAKEIHTRTGCSWDEAWLAATA